MTNLVRSIDPAHPSNRAILIISGLAALATLALDLDGGLSGARLWHAVAVAGTTFLAWALGRELDHDHPASATVAAVLSGTAAILLEPGSLIILVSILFTARVLARTTGRPPTPLDMVGLVALGVALGLTEGGWAFALTLAYAVARSRTLPGIEAKFSRLTSLLIAAFATGLAVRAGVGVWTRPEAPVIVLGLAGLGAAISLRHYLPRSRTDRTSAPVEFARFVSARRITAAGLVIAAILGGHVALHASVAAWLSFVAVALVDRGVIPKFHRPA